jgi:hypothetical protein
MTRTSKQATTSPPARRQVPWLTLGRASLWLGTLAGVSFGLHALDAYADSQRPSQPRRLVWDNLPAWLGDPQNADVLREIEQATGLFDGQRSLEDDALCANVGSSLARCAWVEQVERVTKRQDGEVRIRAAFRRPVTMIVKDGTAYLVDEGAVRLPRQIRAAFLDARHWVLLQGVGGDLPEIGRPWAGKDALAGVRLVRIVNEAYQQRRPGLWEQLVAVDVSNFEGRQSRRDGRLRITTLHPETVIHWGLPPGEEYPVESPVERKLAHLEGLYEEFGERWVEVGPIDIRAQDRVLTGSPK